MRTRPVSRRAVVIVVLTLIAGGCSIAIDWPKNDGDRVCPPVQVVVNWKGDMSNFAAALDGVDVTSQFFVSYSNQRASAQLTTTTGSHTIVARGVFQGLFGPSSGDATRTFTVPGLSLTTNPTSLKLAKNSSAPVAVIASSGCGGGTVNVTFPTLPPGVTATPSTLTITSSATTNIQASASAPTGKYTVPVSGTAGSLSASTSFSIDLGTPTVTSVTPNVQVKGGTLTIAGSGFDPLCTLNLVTLGGVNVTPSICSPAGTSVSIQIPPQANYGATQTIVTVGGLLSNSVPLTIARDPGNFVTANVVSQLSSNRTCSNANGSAGNVSVQVAQLGTNSYRATYKLAGAVVGSAINFAPDNPAASASNYGGAGFSLCAAGLVLDAGLRKLNLLNFDTGAVTVNTFFFLTPTGNFVGPQIFRSPDGTIILFLTAGSGQNFGAALIDVDKVHFGQVIATSQVCLSAPMAAINGSNEIELSCGGTQKTTFPIP